MRMKMNDSLSVYATNFGGRDEEEEEERERITLFFPKSYKVNVTNS